MSEATKLSENDSYY